MGNTVGNEQKAGVATPAPADEAAELRKQVHEVEDKLAAAEIAKAKLQGEAKDQKALEDILAGVKSTADQAKNAADAAEKAQAEAEKVRQEMEKTMAEAERARAEARVRAVEAERARTSTTTAAVPVEIQAEPLRVRLQAHGREVIGGAMVLAIIALLVAVYCFFRQPAATQSPPVIQPAPVPSIYRVVPDAQGNPTLKKVGQFLRGLAEGTAYGEDKAVAVPEPSVIIYDDKTKDLVAAQAEADKLKVVVADLEKKLSQAQSRGTSSSALKVELKMRKGALTRAQLRLSAVMAERDAARAEVVAAKEKIELGAQTSTVEIVKAQLGVGATSPLEDLTEATAEVAEFGFQPGAQQATPVNLQVKARCDGTEISSVYGWGNSYYACVQKPNLVPAKKDGEKEKDDEMSFSECVLYFAGGGALVGGSIGTILDPPHFGAVGSFGGGAAGAVGGGGVGLIVCGVKELVK